jgi:DNA topoisomerase-1
METKLDEIATGKENWERYIIDWNEDYFAPALKKALPVVKTVPTAHQGGNLLRGKESKVRWQYCKG